MFSILVTHRVLQSITEHLGVLQNITEYNRVLQSIKEYYRVLHSITEYYRVLQSITEYYRILQSITECYRVFLAHLLGPISGLVLHRAMEIREKWISFYFFYKSPQQ